ncbi:hypothetical protein ACFOU2_22010 [Bacillus songklensis]|uniref:Uncharacterized protein n=1 Tax=Bacillus songklensis TaxID=1069116 RepID=A0ABV8B9D6_9BACI
MEKTLQAILESLNRIEDRLVGVEQRLDRLEEGQVRIESKIAGIPESYENLEQFVGKQQRIIDELAARSVEYGVEIKTLNKVVRNQ